MQRVDLAPEVSGEILEVCCADGAIVNAGDVLFRLNPIRYKSALKNAQAKVAECKSRKLYADSALTPVIGLGKGIREQFVGKFLLLYGVVVEGLR